MEKGGFKQALHQARQALQASEQHIESVEPVEPESKQQQPAQATLPAQHHLKKNESSVVSQPTPPTAPIVSEQLEPEFSDEMRLGLQGQVRRVLAPKGVKIIQPLQREYKYEYLLLSVNPKTGHLRWAWIARMKQELIKPILQAWAIQLLFWDGAGVHHGKDLAGLPGKRIFHPAYSPELNPAERIFEEVRRFVEGEVYPTLAAKRQAADDFLTKLAAHPQRVISLCLWGWIEEALCVT